MYSKGYMYSVRMYVCMYIYIYIYIYIRVGGTGAAAGTGGGYDAQLPGERVGAHANHPRKGEFGDG